MLDTQRCLSLFPFTSYIHPSSYSQYHIFSFPSFPVCACRISAYFPLVSDSLHSPLPYHELVYWYYSLGEQHKMQFHNCSLYSLLHNCTAISTEHIFAQAELICHTRLKKHHYAWVCDEVALHTRFPDPYAIANISHTNAYTKSCENTRAFTDVFTFSASPLIKNCKPLFVHDHRPYRKMTNNAWKACHVCWTHFAYQ
jgi:hypothetical protein